MDVEESTVLSSWKDIARYLGKGVRTVQRWERELGLPVRRPVGASQKSAVLLHRGDVDAWLATRFSSRGLEVEKGSLLEGKPNPARARLKANMQTARELRDTHHALTLQILETIRQLTERCERLSTQSQQPSPESSAVAPSLPKTGPEQSGRVA